MACPFGDQLVTSYHHAVAAARLSGSTLKHQALADVALMALLTHEQECRSCRVNASEPGIPPRLPLRGKPAKLTAA